VGDEDGNPGKQTEDRDQVDEVSEDNLCGAGNVHESQAAESGREEERGNGHTTLVGLGEELGSVALNSLTVKRTAGNVEIGVGGGEDEDQDAGVENAREFLDAGFVNGNNEGRSGGGALVTVLRVYSLVQLSAVVRHAHSKEENREDVEHNDTPESELDGARDITARVLGLTHGDTDKFCSKEGEDCSDHRGPDGKEAASRTGCLVGLESARSIPVFETDGVVTRDTTGGDADHENEESNNDDNLR
jgi:hypothetical protein